MSLSVIALLPVLVSLLLNALFRSERMKTVTYKQRQIIAGVIFGILAIAGTEFGVPVEGAILNARDAAPLCAGLIFGGPAGIIAGLIGGIERWFASSWGAGYYTRTACSISTCLTGLLAAMLRKYMFEDKTADWDQALAAGFMAEIFHMMMIFITNISDVRTAFNYIRICTIPMVAVNAIAVSIAVAALNFIDPDYSRENKERGKTLPVLTEKRLLRVVAIVLIATTAFGYYLQTQISAEHTREVLSLTIADAKRDMHEQFDETVLHTNRLVAEAVNSDPDADLSELKRRYNVYQINIIDKEGIITASSDPKMVGFDMRSTEQSARIFEEMREDGVDGIVLDFVRVEGEESRYLKYSGVKSDIGVIEIVYDRSQSIAEIQAIGQRVASHRRAGENGALIILNDAGKIAAFTWDSLMYEQIGNGKLNESLFSDRDEETVHTTVIENEKYYYMFEAAERYSLISLIPALEGDFERDLSVYLNVFMQTIVYGLMFVVINIIIRWLFVRNIRLVDQSLESITEGKLETKVEVNDTTEFSSLSSGINSMVDALKKYIAEANARIDAELSYARDIQTSVLPSHFPAFPNRDEFDIYALMDPAREVGGDFYDFYFIDGKHLVFAIADVSGKGIPAALFMMRTKTLLKTYATYGIAVGDIFTNGNYMLREENDADMFVTAWMGMLNLETGELKYVNAGHNPPLIRRKNGTFEYLRGRSGLVLAGMKNIVYKEQILMLEPGDEIFLYTDGIVEAHSTEDELYGDDRLKNFMNENLIGKNAKEICEAVEQDVRKFYEGAPQFDDMTELSIQFLHYKDPN